MIGAGMPTAPQQASKKSPELDASQGAARGSAVEFILAGVEDPSRSMRMTRFPARARLRRVITVAVLLFAYAGCSSESEQHKETERMLIAASFRAEPADTPENKRRSRPSPRTHWSPSPCESADARQGLTSMPTRTYVTASWSAMRRLIRTSSSSSSATHRHHFGPSRSRVEATTRSARLSLPTSGAGESSRRVRQRRRASRCRHPDAWPRWCWCRPAPECGSR